MEAAGTIAITTPAGEHIGRATSGFKMKAGDVFMHVGYSGVGLVCVTKVTQDEAGLRGAMTAHPFDFKGTVNHEVTYELALGCLPTEQVGWWFGRMSTDGTFIPYFDITE